MPRFETQRIDIRMPVDLLKEIEQYQETHGIPCRTKAMIALMRQGLKKKIKRGNANVRNDAD